MNTERTPRAFSPDRDRPASSITEQLAELQEDFGRVTAAATKAVKDGRLSFLERSALSIRARRLHGKLDDLLEVLQ